MRGGGDIEEDHFIGALLIIAQGQFDRVPHIAQFAGFGPSELLTAGNLSGVHVKAGYDSFSHHGPVLKRFGSGGSTMLLRLRAAPGSFKLGKVIKCITE